MSLDFSNYPELDPAVYRDEQQHPLHLNGYEQGAGAAAPHDRFPMQDHLSYGAYADADDAASSSYSTVPRYGASLPSAQSALHQPHGAHGQQQQHYPYGSEYQMYPHQQSMYPDPLAVPGQQPGLPFDLLGSQQQQPQQPPPGASQQAAQQHPYHRQNGPAYPYGAAPPTVPSNAPLSQQSAFSDVLMPSADRHRAMQGQAYPGDNYGLALSSALGGNMGPSPLSQYGDRSVAYQSPDSSYPQAPPVAPSQQALPVGSTADDVRAYDHQMRFASPTGPSPPQHQAEHVGVTSPTGNISVNDELAKLNLQPSPGPSSADLVSFMRPYLEQYVNAPNRIAFGERTLIVMSSKVAQKSYGTEKRFLCPPPTAVLIGNEWWSEISRRGSDQGKLLPPRVVVSISGEPTPPECTVDWISAAGKSFDPSDPPPTDATTFIGRAVGKQLFISEVDEKKKKVEALVHVTAPAVDDGPERVIGIFKSRPIKVISKPSKKRQSAKNLELCINHGSTIALFHRLRAQTVSTKYLCVSGSGTAFKGSDGAPLLDTTSHRTGSPSFVAQTTSWDSFIMYIVDVNKPPAAADAAAPPPPPPFPGYPSPPPNAIPFQANGSQIPIYYNQTVVLQCLTSGVVSPVLIIRKVDHSTMVVGGGVQDTSKNVPDSYCCVGEVCGDPVSQLHKVAFEVHDPAKGAPELGHPGMSSSFLACMGEKVNTHHPEEMRAWNSPAHSSPASHSPSLPGSPIISTPTSATSASGEYFNGTGGMSPSDHDFPSSDGGRVRRKRNSTSREGRAPTATKARRARQSSTGSNRGGSGGEGPQAGMQASGSLWSIDVGETSIWTIVGTDQVRYNFYIPPALFEPGTPPQPYAHAIPSKQVTPFPDVVKYLPPDRAAEVPPCSSNRKVASAAMQNRMLTVYGTNFSKADPVSVFFGTEPSPHVEVRCTEVLACLPPEKNPPPSSKPMLLVRGDGVVFPSNCMYP
ncbi:LAG1-DNAbind-domain-containing protein [Exidia glandulosa HHB12029]|uniref:LAG1-DNAbind-domain-containing protein n=1 Tax=Exidia glandulosa HHB12029 TaxID=1314781 RepID=A0A166B494_EXIGL|nr:LAG1-DNAbind-domain-containing protein [Exidia glandulosa HHB12029]